MLKSITIDDLKPETYVLRLGHRPERDKRITTHVALVARAFGCRGFYLANTSDEKLRTSIKKVLRLWGGENYFIYEDNVNYINLLKEWRRVERRCIVHLTMYGLPTDLVINDIREKCDKILIVVGAEKVPREVFELSHYNVSVTSQPHSEVSALAVFLDRLYGGSEMSLIFNDAKIRVIPDPRGKKVIKLSQSTT